MAGTTKTATSLERMAMPMAAALAQTRARVGRGPTTSATLSSIQKVVMLSRRTRRCR